MDQRTEMVAVCASAVNPHPKEKIMALITRDVLGAGGRSNIVTRVVTNRELQERLSVGRPNRHLRRALAAVRRRAK